MQAIQRWLPWIRVATVAVLVWCFAAHTVLAETPPGAASQADKSYVIPYALVVLACALGLLIVCRSSYRTTELKRMDDD